MIYPAITLYQPWATWIMRGWKKIETRTHNRFKSLQGETILIHAGLSTDSSSYATHNPYLTPEQIRENPDEMVNGYILGQAHVYLSKYLYVHDSPQALIECASERWGLFLDSVKKFKDPILCKGEMGIWYFDTETMQKVKKGYAIKKDLFNPHP